jgi:hypothetical protein
MSVESQHLVIPRPNFFEPRPEAVATLVERLIAAGWIEKETGHFRESRADRSKQSPAKWNLPLPAPMMGDWLAARAQHDVHLSWTMTMRDPKGKDPFVRDRCFYDELYYSLRIEIAGRDHGYVRRVGESVADFESTECACGASLGFEIASSMDSPLDRERLHTRCPECALPFDVSTLEATYRRFPEERFARKGRCEGPLLGGATSRFAIIIACGEDVPGFERGHMPTLRPELLGLCSGALGCSLYEVWDENC